MFNINDKSKAVCGFCEKVVTTTFKIRNVPVKDSDKVIKDILVGVCDECDNVVTTPAQSTPEIKRQLNN